MEAVELVFGHLPLVELRSLLIIDPGGRIHLDPSMTERIELLDRNAEIIPVPPLGSGDAWTLPGS